MPHSSNRAANIQAVIFDMDGLLIDSEPLWRDAEVEVFTALGIPMTHDECRETMGLRLDEVVRYWQRKKKWESDEALDAIAERVVDTLISQIEKIGKPKAGVKEVLDHFRSRDVRMCVASSSSSRVIQAVVDSLGLKAYLEF